MVSDSAKAHCGADDQGSPLPPTVLTVVTGRLQWNDQTTGQTLAVSSQQVADAHLLQLVGRFLGRIVRKELQHWIVDAQLPLSDGESHRG